MVFGHKVTPNHIYIVSFDRPTLLIWSMGGLITAWTILHDAFSKSQNTVSDLGAPRNTNYVVVFILSSQLWKKLLKILSLFCNNNSISQSDSLLHSLLHDSMFLFFLLFVPNMPQNHMHRTWNLILGPTNPFSRYWIIIKQRFFFSRRRKVLSFMSII